MLNLVNAFSLELLRLICVSGGRSSPVLCIRAVGPATRVNLDEYGFWFCFSSYIRGKQIVFDLLAKEQFIYELYIF